MPATADQDRLIVRGAREHNLKNVSLELPRDSLIVFTGISGSGKSSLAFDTIYAEGQRRYVESLSSYARQFLGQMDKPDVDFIEGLSPAISIDQKSAPKNPRSTVGTITEIYDYLRLLYARIGRPHCHNCGRPIARQTPEQIVDQVLACPRAPGSRCWLRSFGSRKGEFTNLFEDLDPTRVRPGPGRRRGAGAVREDQARPLLPARHRRDRRPPGDQGGDRQPPDGLDRDRLKLAEGTAAIDLVDDDAEDILFSQYFACTVCGISFDELAPRNFSFNSPYGACERCDGLGTHLEVDVELVIPNEDLSIKEGAIAPWSGRTLEYFDRLLDSAAKAFGFKTDVPFKRMSKKARELILYGSEDEEIHVRYRNRFNRVRSYWTVFEGVIPWLERRHRKRTRSSRAIATSSTSARFRAPSAEGRACGPNRWPSGWAA